MYNVVCSLMMGHSQKLGSLLRVHLGSVKQLPTDPVVLGVVCVCVCVHAHMCVLVTQLCPTLCYPMAAW